MGKILSKSKLFMKRNGATILTCVGGVGVVATSVMAVKATPKALQIIEEAEKEKGEKLTKFEVVRTAGPAYVPAVLVGVGTLACIFGANMLNKRQQASLVSAYALLDSSYKDYRRKVADLYGAEAEGKVKEELAKDKYEKEDITIEDDKRLFYDDFSGRYFESTLQKVQQAEYQLNRDISMRDYATLNEFYDYLGIDGIESGDDLGWSSSMNFDYYWQSWVDFNHRRVTMDDELECIIIQFFCEPTMYWSDYC